MIVVDKSETKLYFVSDFQSDSSISINTAYKINVAFLSMENYLFISYMKSNFVPVYVLYFSKDEITEENKINVEFFREIAFSVQYLIFDIDESGLGLIFYGKNYIQLYNMRSAYNIEYIRQLPLFRYAKEYQFAYNSNVNDIVYIRYEGFLYVVFKHHINPVERYLMIYDLNDNTHNSLNKVISLSKSYFHTDLYLFAEKISTASTIYLYVFYGDDIYQFIKVEPDNILKREYNETGNLFFLPKTVSDMPIYPPGNITLLIHPLYSPYTHYRNTTMVLNINWVNIGLMLEARTPGKNIDYIHNDNDLTLSFLDFFDGFNSSYRLLNENQIVEESTQVSITKDRFETYIIESVSDSNYVILSFMWSENFLFLFYNGHGSQHLMQVSIFTINWLDL